jgi:hypothetical protein
MGVRICIVPYTKKMARSSTRWLLTGTAKHLRLASNVDEHQYRYGYRFVAFRLLTGADFAAEMTGSKCLTQIPVYMVIFPLLLGY